MKSLFGKARTVVKGRYIIATRRRFMSTLTHEIPLKLIDRTSCEKSNCKWKKDKVPCDRCCKFMFRGYWLDIPARFSRRTHKRRMGSLAGFDIREATEAEMVAFLL